MFCGKQKYFIDFCDLEKDYQSARKSCGKLLYQAIIFNIFKIQMDIVQNHVYFYIHPENVHEN